VWKAACGATGVETSLYEGTKHSRATDLLRQGVSERVLQALLGHRDARSTRSYARLADEALVAAIRPRCGSNVDPAANLGEKEPGKTERYGGGAGNRTRVHRLILQGFSGDLEAAARLQPRSGLPIAPARRDDGFDEDPLTIQGPKNQEHGRQE
jgi:hypothetical protein